MKPTKPVLLFVAVVVTFAALIPARSSAAIRLVVTNTSQCPSDTTTYPFCYQSLDEAITNAVSGDSIEIRPGTYPGNFTLDKNVTLYGTETGKTFLDGNGTGTVLTVSNVTGGVTIRRLTFIRAATGLLISNSPSVVVSNCVFETGASNVGVQINSSTGVQIINNAFYDNGTGISSNLNDVNITNNIFSNIGTAISTNVVIDSILNNLFYSYSLIGPAGISFDPADLVNYKGNIRDVNPLFVNASDSVIANRDFHLESTTPGQDAGNASGGNDSIDGTTPDIGAYGGANADTKPFPVSGLSVTNVTTDTITLSWSPNLCYLIGGYNVSYGTSSGQYSATVDAGNNTTFDLTGLSSAATPTGGAPILSITDVSSGTLVLAWDASGVSGATGYEIRYDTSSPPLPPAPATFSEDAGNTIVYPLQGLTNDIDYYIVVIPYAQSTYYIVVQAYYAANTSFVSSNSSEASQTIGDKAYGKPSAPPIIGRPEALIPYPNLPNTRQGCFIATAAYGSYSDPQVMILRRFRDQVLMTNGPGRAFVRWYYTYGPAAADWLNAHAEFKPLVRAALLPLVGLAFFMTRTAPAVQISVVMLIITFLVFLYYRKRLSAGGGPH